MTAPDSPSVEEGDATATAPEDPQRRGWWITAGLVLVAAVVVGLIVLLGGDDEDDGDRAASTTQAPATTAATTSEAPTTSSAPSADTTAIWPFPGSSTTYATPEDAARSFATEFLRFTEPVVGEFRQGDQRSGEVPIRPTEQGPVTTILVRQVGSGDDWSVLGAATENIQLTEPAARARISSPVAVAGRALAFEGTVNVEVRQDGALGAIGEGFVTGGGDQLRDFSGSIPFETAGAPYGALVLFTQSAEDGRVWEAMAIRVALASTDADAAGCGGQQPARPRPGAGEMEVKVYFNCDGEQGEVAPRPVYRSVPESSGVLQASLEALLEGPSAEERAASYSSWFSESTAGLLRSVTIGDGGHAVVDFGDLPAAIPGASSSAGSALLLSQLDATVFQFRNVESVEYRLQGDCRAFNEWLQLGGCEPRTRPASED